MDAFLALIVAMVIFVVLIIIINRSIKTVVVFGAIVLVVLALRAFGILG